MDKVKRIVLGRITDLSRQVVHRSSLLSGDVEEHVAIKAPVFPVGRHPFQGMASGTGAEN